MEIGNPLAAGFSRSRLPAPTIQMVQAGLTRRPEPSRASRLPRPRVNAREQQNERSQTKQRNSSESHPAKQATCPVLNETDRVRAPILCKSKLLGISQME